MLVAFARNQTMVSMKGNGDSVIFTDPQPVGGANYAEATLNVPVIFSQNAGTPTLTVQAWGSNDAVNWFQISGITFAVTSTSAAPYQDADYVTCAFLRFKITLTTTAALDDNLAVATFDLHVNLTNK
jgi:hypothetical protein